MTAYIWLLNRSSFACEVLSSPSPSTPELAHLYLLVVGLAWCLELVSVEVMSPEVDVSPTAAFRGLFFMGQLEQLLFDHSGLE